MERRLQVYALLKESNVATRAIRSMLEHPRNQQLIMEGGRFHFLERTASNPSGRLVPLKGLTRVLREFYWPHYSPWTKTAGVQKPGNPNKAGNATTTKHRWNSPISSATGSVRGSIVHRQIAEFVTEGRDYLLKNNSTVHRMVPMALKTLQQKRLYPVEAEVRVACVEARLGTAIDLKCVNTDTGVPCDVEIKTSSSRRGFEFDDPEGNFAGELAHLNTLLPRDKILPYSDLSRARIQLGISILMGIEGIGYHGKFDAFVLLLAADQKEGICYPVDEEFMLTYAIPLYNDIKKRLPLWRAEQRRKTKRQRTI
jgi:hypothetical protein